MRHLSAAIVAAIVIPIGIALPGASAQEANLESCSISPSTSTIGPGEVAEFTFTFTPPGAESIFIVTLDGELLSEGFASTPDESPTTAGFAYDDLVAEFSEVLGRPITDGVVEFSFSIVVGEGDDERLEALCSHSVVLVGSPEPEPETTTTVPLPEPATPRFTG